MDMHVPFILSDIDSLISSDFFKNNLKGRNGLRSKIKDDAQPLIRYMHRMICFYSGINVHIPTMTKTYLQEYVDNYFGQTKTCRHFKVYILEDGVEDIYHKLNEHARELCDFFGLDKNAVAKRWNKVIYG